MLKIATWNLNQSVPGRVRANRQLNEIEKIGADVWILAEAHPEFSPGVAGGHDPVAKATNAAHAAIDHICTTDRKVNGRGCWPQIHEQLKGLSDHFGSWVTIDRT